MVLKRHQPTRLTLAIYHAQQAQAAQVLNSEQPHPGKNSCQLTMLCDDEIDMLQNGNTRQRRLQFEFSCNERRKVVGR